MKQRTILKGLGGILVAALALTGCSSPSPGGTTDNGDTPDYPKSQITINSPFDPGGGIDLAINMVIKALKETGLTTTPLRLSNLPGGSGAVATATLASDNDGDDDVLLITSVSNLASTLQNPDHVGLLDMTPLAGLYAEYTYAYVRHDSPYKTLDDVVNAIAADPGGVRIGGASLGSADNIVVAQLARSKGVEFSQLAYLPLPGDQNQTNLLGGQIDVAFGGPDLLPLVESGDARVLAVSAPERLTAAKVKEIPTMSELGYEVTQSNWRGAFGPPNMPDYAVDYWNETFKKLSESSEWADIADNNVWDITGLDRDEFIDFLSQESKALTEELTALGLIK